MMNLARDLFTIQQGERIPTILEYTERLSVSRGIVQNAINQLVEDGCIQIEKKGVKGTFLVGADYEKLYIRTNWGSITGTMPVPLNPFLSSLSTAVCAEMERAPFPFSFAYVTGSEKRLEMLKEMMYDFIIVSQSTAQIYLEKYDFVSNCISLKGCVYSPEFVTYFFDSSKREIEDGMRVGIDPKSLDQAMITRKLCEGKHVSFVEFPYIAFEDLIMGCRVDCVVYRALDWSTDLSFQSNVVKAVGVNGFSDDETRTPVLLVHKDNYGIERLLRQYLDRKRAGEVQREVLNGKRAVRFY